MIEALFLLVSVIRSSLTNQTELALENLASHAEPLDPFAPEAERQLQAAAWRAWFQANPWDAIEQSLIQQMSSEDRATQRRAIVALGHVGMVMLTCQSQAFANLRRRLSAVGRMAFSNYILQSIICTTVFYGYGLGLFGHLNRFPLMIFVVAIWLLQLWLSPWWLARFRYGPLEWLWRTLTYGRRQSMTLNTAEE